MKRINNLILALAGLFAVACADTFEERYDLSVNTDKYSVDATAARLPITVYCSGAWTAQLAAESAWATLSRTSGSGITTIHLDCADNSGLARSVGVVLRGSGLEKSITVVQKAGITAPELIFLAKDLAFANGAYKGTTAFETNLPDELLREVVPAVTYASEGDAWISDIAYHADDTEAGETEIPLARRGLITFSTAANATGEPRTATVDFSVEDANGNVFGDSFTVTQSADEGRITLSDDVVPIEGGKRTVAFSTNLGALLGEMKTEVMYADPAAAGFISNVELGAESLTYDISENTGVEKRYATITVSYTDLAGNVISASSAITQRVTAQPREIPFADLRALFTAEDKPYASDEDHIDYLLCRVIGDAGNPNMEQNVNTGPNSITTDENDRTNYVQSLDGMYGFRLKFASAADNACLRGEQVKILLDGVTLSRESDPMRYTLRGVKAENVEKVAGAAALEPKARTISTLTDDDLYTYCTLSGLEFSVKEGAYANVREYDAILNPYNEGITFASGTQAQRAKDGAANLLYDGSNDAIYMLVNMNCAWRRTGQSVPQGVGSVSGIVVHTPMERWGGNVGRYSIRPFDEADIDVARAEASSYAKLVEWRLDKGVVSVGAYVWNDGSGYTVGNATNSAAQLVQNRMHATTDNTGGTARLYSENRMLNQTVTADRSYPVAIVHGYRGLSASNYVAGDGTTMGMSKYTMLAFCGNVAGWYDWNGNTWTGKTNGIVMEFPTSGVGGSAAAVSFSIAAGKHSTNEAACSWTNASSYPVYWKVEYATSTDNGVTWSDWTEAVNAATGVRGFEMRSLPWCINNSATRTSIFDTANQSGVYTQSDFGFGLVPYRFVLPADVLGKSKVRVRISPSSDIIATWNAGLGNYGLGQTYRNVRVARTYPFDIANAVYVEDLSIQYK